MLYHLYTAERNTFFAVVLIAVAVTTVELLYFERDVIEEEIDLVTPRAGDSSD
jgi:hypothetical protein